MVDGDHQANLQAEDECRIAQDTRNFERQCRRKRREMKWVVGVRELGCKRKEINDVSILYYAV